MDKGNRFTRIEVKLVNEHKIISQINASIVEYFELTDAELFGCNAQRFIIDTFAGKTVSIT